MLKKSVSFILAFLSLFICVSCSGGETVKNEISATAVPTPKLPQINGIGFSPGLAPVTITRSQTAVEKNVIFYPCVVGDGAKPLNDAIYTSIITYLKYVSSPIYTYYSIKYNKNNMLSILVSYNLINTSETAFLLPLNFYVDSAQAVRLSDCLNSQDEAWRSALSDNVAKLARERGITLLGDIPPISNGQLFYFDETSLTLVYRPYEISTYLPASPEFSFNIEELSAYIVSGSCLYHEGGME